MGDWTMTRSFCPHGVYLNTELCKPCQEKMDLVRSQLAGEPCICPQPPYDVSNPYLYTGIFCPKHGKFTL